MRVRTEPIQNKVDEKIKRVSMYKILRTVSDTFLTGFYHCFSCVSNIQSKTAKSFCSIHDLSAIIISLF